MFYKKTQIFLNKVRSAEIVKVFSFTTIATIVKMLTGLVSVKVVASIIGPPGIALLGQLNNFLSIMMVFACGGISEGIVKYVSEYKEDKVKLEKYISGALKIILVSSIMCGVFIIFLHSWLSNLIFLSSKYGYVFVIFGLTLLLYALNNFLISILNGFKEFKIFVKVSILGSIIGLISTLSFVFFLGIKGALISAVTFQSIVFFTTLWMVRKSAWFKKTVFTQKFDRYIIKKYAKYSLMAIVTAVTVPVTQLFLRSYIISNISEVEAGWWEAMNRISFMYLMIVTSSFGIYYLPRLSEIKNDLELRREIFKAYKVIIPIITLGFLIIYIMRFFIVETLFTADFLPMVDLFVWQLIGDFFKIASWLLAFLMIAKTMTKLFIITEIAFSCLIVLMGTWFVSFNGVIGITQAYMVNYFVYMILMLIVFRRLVFFNSKKNN